MRKSTLLLLSGRFLGFASYVEPNKCDPQIGDDSKKGPPGIKIADWAYLNGADRTIAIDGTSNYTYAELCRSIISTMQMGKSSIDELSDDVENRTTAHFRKLNQSIDYKTNYTDIIIKTNEFNQI